MSKSIIADDATSCDVQYFRETETTPIKLVTSGFTTVTDPVQYFYKDGSQTDISSSSFSGSLSVSGTDIISKTPLNTIKAGRYVLSIFATMDGVYQCAGTIPWVIKRRGEQ
jgi:hypothetical protein